MCASHDADVRRVVTRLHGRPVLLLYARWAVALNADLASEVLGQHRAVPDDARLVLAPALEPTPRPVPQPIHSNSGCSSTSYGWRPAASSSSKASTPRPDPWTGVPDDGADARTGSTLKRLTSALQLVYGGRASATSSGFPGG
jgi:hypothetical protein